MNIIKRELRAHLRSLLIWCGSIIAFIFIMFSEFAGYYNNPEMADVLDSMPKAMLDAFSISGANLTTVSGYTSIASVYIYLALGIYAALLGSSIIAKEERDKTAEFFLTLPVSRQRVIFGKLTAAVICNIGVNIATTAGIYGATMQYDKMADFDRFMFLLMFAIFIIQMIFLSIGMLLSAIMKRYRKSGTYATGLLLFLYVVSVFTSLSKDLENLKYLTPFKYFEASYIVRELSYDTVFVLISIGIITASIIGTFLIYPKRDLRI